jgi:hypothetical protein
MNKPDPRNPHNLPPPPKIGGIPTGPNPRAEWLTWLESCKAAFAMLRAAKDKLRHDENEMRADNFRHAVNEAWREMTKGKEGA